MSANIPSGISDIDPLTKLLRAHTNTEILVWHGDVTDFSWNASLIVTCRDEGAMHLDKLLTESWCRWGWSGGPVRLRRRWWSPWCRSILKDTWNSFYIPLRRQRTGAQGRRVASDSDVPWRLLNINKQRGRLRSVLVLARTSSECSSTEESPDTGWYSCSSVPEGAFCLGRWWEGVLKLAENQNSHLMSEKLLQSMCVSVYYLF